MRHASRWYEVYKVKDLTKYEKYVCETKPVPKAVWDAILPAHFYTEGGIKPKKDITVKPAGGDKVTASFVLTGTSALGFALPPKEKTHKFDSQILVNGCDLVRDTF